MSQDTQTAPAATPPKINGQHYPTHTGQLTVAEPPVTSSAASQPGFWRGHFTRAGRLQAQVYRARQVAELQHAPELRERLSALERFQDSWSARRDRGAARGYARRERTHTRRMQRTQQTTDQAAAKTRAKRQRLLGNVTRLARLARVNPLVIGLLLSPGVAGIVAGAGNVQRTMSQLLGVTGGLHYWLLAGIEVIASAPLVGLLLLDLTRPPQLDADRRSLRQRFTEGFGPAKLFLLVASVVFNCVPHVLLSQWGQAAFWLIVPASIAASMSMLPRAVSTLETRTVQARTEAELGAPLGKLSEAEARTIRQARVIQQLVTAGTLPADQPDGLPSATKITEALRGMDGHASKPQGARVRAVLVGMTGADEDTSDFTGA